MKPSKIALLSIGGIVVAAIIGVAMLARVTLGWGEQGAWNDSDPGELTTQNRDLSGFSGLEINGSWTVAVTQGDEWQVELSYPENVLRADDVSVRGGQLSLDGSRSGSLFGRSNTRLTAEIVMPELEELEAAGQNRVTLSGFEGERLTINVAGANHVTGEDGRYRELDLSMAGASNVQLDGIAFTDANVDLAGASNLTLTMDGGELNGSLAGAGRIEYSGTVSREAVDVAGFGWVGPAAPSEQGGLRETR